MPSSPRLPQNLPILRRSLGKVHAAVFRAAGQSLTKAEHVIGQLISVAEVAFSNTLSYRQMRVTLVLYGAMAMVAGQNPWAERLDGNSVTAATIAPK